jgi:hypothetical protein
LPRRPSSAQRTAKVNASIMAGRRHVWFLMRHARGERSVEGG